MKAVVPFRNDLARMLLIVTQGMAPQVLKVVSRSTHGTCKLLTNDLFGLPLPIPPLPEQMRIVARVDELMALCDRLEAAHAERERRRDRLAVASLSRLSEPMSASESREHVRFHLHHLPRLSTRREHIKDLRQTILGLAVQGRLVPQLPEDQSAYDLLARINTEKARQLQSGELRRQQSLPPSNAQERPFEIPQLWRWIRMDDCFNVAGGIQKTPARTPRQNAHPYVGVGNVHRGHLDLSRVKQLELLEGELEKFRLKNPDILVVEGMAAPTKSEGLQHGPGKSRTVFIKTISSGVVPSSCRWHHTF